ncbi:MAG: pyrroline-5-carboxylate reductase [Candidatus Riflebacteria bacterium]|nr:pyrroline-5-carboxylate reductase [Candidatus Riflebacteria bacterium]
MHHEHIGFIGSGNIAESIIRGLITSGHVDPGQIIISDVRQEQLDRVHQTLGPMIAASNQETVARANIVFLAVKPAQVPGVARELRDVARSDQFFISVAAGTSLARVRDALGEKPRLCRIMPNLSASVRKSIISLYAEPAMTIQDLAPVYSVLSQVGKVFRVEDEALMSVTTALSGSAPAYYLMMAEALVEFGISQGLPREIATAMILMRGPDVPRDRQAHEERMEHEKNHRNGREPGRDHRGGHAGLQGKRVPGDLRGGPQAIHRQGQGAGRQVTPGRRSRADRRPGPHRSAVPVRFELPAHDEPVAFPVPRPLRAAIGGGSTVCSFS